jgi:Rrf2 family protein
MKITALEEYGLRCLLRVAEHDEDEPVSAREIADREGLSLPYTQKLMRTLSEGGMVEARRGPHGGYFLSASADEITLGDVMRQLGGMLEMEEFCQSHTGKREVCARACSCNIKPVWRHISEFLVQTMDNISLRVLIEGDEAVEQCLPELTERSDEGFEGQSLEPPRPDNVSH